MSNPDDIFEAITRIIQEELGWKETLTRTHPVKELDSMQQLSLVVAIEDHFEICLDPDDENHIETLQDLVLLVQKKRQTGV